MTRDKKDRQVRALQTGFEVREEAEQLHITGYFSVFGGTYEIGPGMTESVDRHAFDNTLGGDIRALTNHDTSMVLGRTKAHTLELRVDEHGLWGDITINPNDQDAMNLYARVERGDVSQCSFGCYITREETEFLENGDIEYIIKAINLLEISVVTFPAYEDTGVEARANHALDLRRKQIEAWKDVQRHRLYKQPERTE